MSDPVSREVAKVGWALVVCLALSIVGSCRVESDLARVNERIDRIERAR